MSNATSSLCLTREIIGKLGFYILQLSPKTLFPIMSGNAEWGSEVYKNGLLKVKDIPLLIGW